MRQCLHLSGERTRLPGIIPLQAPRWKVAELSPGVAGTPSRAAQAPVQTNLEEKPPMQETPSHECGSPREGCIFLLSTGRSLETNSLCLAWKMDQLTKSRKENWLLGGRNRNLLELPKAPGSRPPTQAPMLLKWSCSWNRIRRPQKHLGGLGKYQRPVHPHQGHGAGLNKLLLCHR